MFKTNASWRATASDPPPFEPCADDWYLLDEADVHERLESHKKRNNHSELTEGHEGHAASLWRTASYFGNKASEFGNKAGEAIAKEARVLAEVPEAGKVKTFGDRLARGLLRAGAEVAGSGWPRLRLQNVSCNDGMAVRNRAAPIRVESNRSGTLTRMRQSWDATAEASKDIWREILEVKHDAMDDICNGIRSMKSAFNNVHENKSCGELAQPTADDVPAGLTSVIEADIGTTECENEADTPAEENLFEIGSDDD